MNLKEVYNNVLTEASLSRVWKLIEDDKYSFAVISASRKSNSPDENKKNYFQLKKDVVQNKLGGFVELRGGYVETEPSTGEKFAVTEDSLLIGNISKDAALQLGAKYNQEAILYKDANGFELLSTEPSNSGTVLASFKKGAGKDNLALGQDALSQYFSELKKGSHANKKFNFVQEQREYSWMKALAHIEKKWYTLFVKGD